MSKGTKQITVAGGNLFRLAAEHLGSATQWTRIVQANPGLPPDPWLGPSVMKIIIPRPSLAADNGGVLGSR